eukprot:624749-Pelagomonas_calceolata.AAC.2
MESPSSEEAHSGAQRTSLPIAPYLFARLRGLVTSSRPDAIDTRPGQQLELAQRQHADLCKDISGKAVTLYTVLLGVGGTCYTEHTLNQFKQLGT